MGAAFITICSNYQYEILNSKGCTVGFSFVWRHSATAKKQRKLYQGELNMIHVNGVIYTLSVTSERCFIHNFPAFRS